MKWFRLSEKRPENGSIVVECTDPFELYKGDFKNHYTLLVKEYKSYVPWEDYVEWSNKNEQPIPNFWWTYAKDFPFPGKD